MLMSLARNGTVFTLMLYIISAPGCIYQRHHLSYEVRGISLVTLDKQRSAYRLEIVKTKCHDSYLVKDGELVWTADAIDSVGVFEYLRTRNQLRGIRSRCRRQLLDPCAFRYEIEDTAVASIDSVRSYADVKIESIISYADTNQRAVFFSARKDGRTKFIVETKEDNQPFDSAVLTSLDGLVVPAVITDTSDW